MNVVLSLMGEINELLKNSFLYLLHLFCCLLKQCPKSTHMPHYLVKTLVLWRKVKLILELITKIQVWSGALRGGNCPGVESLREDAEKSQQCHKCFLQYSRFTSERHQVRTRGHQTCFFPRAPSILVTPQGVVGLTTNHNPTLSSHKSLVGIKF